MVDGGGGRGVHPCHRFCPPPPGVAAPLAGGSEPRVAQAFELALVEGSLLIDDAAEAYPLAEGTSITGKHDTGDGGTGAVTDGSFNSPAIDFQTAVSGANVDVTASFSQVTPNSGTGTIDPDGGVSFRTQLWVDLHLDINDGALTQDCRVGPVPIGLDSSAPWDPDTRQVTVRDPDFTIPVTEQQPNCLDGIAIGPLNDLLAGSGHSLTMTLQGDLELPPPVGCPTTTTLAVSTAESILGEDITFDATVVAAPDDRPECDGIEAGDFPPGSVEFLAGTTQLGVVELNELGQAQLVSADMITGTHALTARYRPVPPFSASRSTAFSHTVLARPTISIDAPAGFTLGIPTEFDVEVTNPTLGRDVTNGRLDITLSSSHGPTYTVERWDGASWVTIPFAVVVAQFPTVVALGMAPGGVSLPPGSSVTQRFRVTPTGTLSTLKITAELVPVDPDEAPPAPAGAPTATALARASVDTIITNAVRRDPILTMRMEPHTVRQGMVVGTSMTLAVPGDYTGPSPSGTYTLLLDGKPVPIRDQRTDPEIGYQPTIPVSVLAGATSPKFVLPPDAAVGTHHVTVRYSGDQHFKPSQVTQSITVVLARGVTYECITRNIILTDQFNLQVEMAGNLPSAVRPGEPVPVSQLDIDLFTDRGDTTFLGGIFFGPTPLVTPESGLDGFTRLDLLFGSQGTATAETAEFTNQFEMDDSTRPEDPAPDMGIAFTGEQADLTFTGAPGEVVPASLSGIELEASLLGGFLSVTVSCTPLGDADVLDSVTIAGTSLSVDAPSPAREGDPVTLDAQVAPAGTPGTVEFRDGDTAVAVVPVNATGGASYTFPDLEPGDYSFSARFTTSAAGVNSVSSAVGLEVLERFDCAEFADEGSAAVVRLVYLELLRRCPDQAGFDFWVGRLDGGTTPERFARTIAATPEAVGVVVDDAYVTMLGRRADAPGKAFWVNRMRTGSGRYDQLLAQLGASDEFWAKSGSTNSGFVTRVYERLLYRAPDQPGLSFWVGRLDSGTPRGTLIVQLANLDEPLGGLVVASYDEILSRPPGGSERSDGIAFLRATGDRSGLYAQLIGRPEFATRAQGFPNPED